MFQTIMCKKSDLVAEIRQFQSNRTFSCPESELHTSIAQNRQKLDQTANQATSQGQHA